MSFISSPKKLMALAGLALTVSGCSALNIGDSDYGCKGMPEGVQCMSTRDVYALTNDGQVPAQVAWKEGDESVVQTAPSHAVRGENPQDVVSTYVAPRLPDQPIPIRTPAEVMRIWIAPWEDTSGDLVVTGYLYTEIEPRRWVIGDQPANTQPTLRPLQSVQPSTREASPPKQEPNPNLPPIR
jgi:conjugal transfer pilus assembly protein TraV